MRLFSHNYEMLKGSTHWQHQDGDLNIVHTACLVCTMCGCMRYGSHNYWKMSHVTVILMNLCSRSS